MLTLIEKLLFVIAVLLSIYFTWLGVRRIIKIIVGDRVNLTGRYYANGFGR